MCLDTITIGFVVYKPPGHIYFNRLLLMKFESLKLHNLSANTHLVQCLIMNKLSTKTSLQQTIYGGHVLGFYRNEMVSYFYKSLCSLCRLNNKGYADFII